MGKTFIFSFFALWLALLPVYIWGYAITVLSQDRWNRERFWFGMFFGAISVGLVFLLDNLMTQSIQTISLGILVILGIFYGIGNITTLFGSQFSRDFIRKISGLHTGIILFLAILLVWISRTFGGSLIIPVMFLSLFLSALFEETAKHLSTLSFIGKDFHFSQRDIILFTFFVALGFVFIENVLYFIHGDFHLTQWVFRSFFTLILHSFAAIVCTYFWWKALSYKLYSIQYIATFLIGFIASLSIHTLYNICLERGYLLGVFGLTIAGYLTLTGLIHQHRNIS